MTTKIAGSPFALLHHSPDAALVTDCHWKVLFANPAAKRLFFNDEELSLPVSFEKIAGMFSRPVEFDRMEKTLKAEQVWEDEIRFSGNEKEERWLKWRHFLIEPSDDKEARYCSLFFDITEEKKASLALEASESRYRMLLETSPDAVVLHDETGEIQSVNLRGAQMFGVDSVDTLIKRVKNIYNILDEAQSIKARANIKKTLDKGVSPPEEYAVTTMNGTPMHVEISSSLLETLEDEPRLILSVVRDITERKEAQRMMHRQIAFENGIAEAGAALLTGDELDEAIQHAINALRQAADTARVYIFENFEDDDDGLCMKQTFESCAPGVEPEIDNPVLQKVIYSDGFSRWERHLSKGEAIEGQIATFPEEEQAILAPQGIISMLVLPILVSGRWWGFIGFDETRVDYDWRAGEITLLRTAAEMIGVYLTRIETEQALRTSQRRYREIFTGSRDGFVMVDDTAKITDANQALCEMLGYTLEELKAMDDFYVITPERWHDWEREEIWKKRLLKEGYSDVYEKEYIRKDGSVFPIELQAYAAFDEAGALDYLWAVVRDITKRKETEQAIAERDRDFTSLLDNPTDYTIYRLRSSGNPLTPTVTHVSPSIHDVLGVAHEDKFDFQRWFTYFHEDDLPRLIEANAEGMKPPFLFDEVLRYNHPKKGLRWLHVRSNGIPYEDDEDNIEWAHGIILDITERKEAEAQYIKVLQQLEQVIKQAPFAAQVVEGSFDNPRVIIENAEAQRLLGQVNEGRDDIDFHEDASLSARFFEMDGQTPIPLSEMPTPQAMGGEVVSNREIFVKNADGANFYVSANAAPIFDAEGKVTAVVVAFYDITERVHLEAEQKRYATRLQVAADSAGIGIWEFDVQSGQLIWDDWMFKLYGYRKGEIETDFALWSNSVHPDDRQRAQFEVQKAIDGIAPFDTQFRVVTPQGEIRHLKAYAKVIRDKDGLPMSMTGVNYEITERIQAIEDLERSEKTLRHAQRIAKIGSWEYDVETDQTKWSAEAYRIFGLPTKQEPPSWAQHEQFVHAEDWPALDAALQDAIAGSDGYEQDFRLITPDGELKLARTICRIERDARGKILRMSGTVQDLTALKSAEQQIQMIFRMSVDLICVFDLESQRFAKINPAFTTLFGYTEHELLTRPLSDFIHPDDIEPTGKIVEQSLKKGKAVINFTNRYRRKDGAIRWIDWIAYPDIDQGITFAIGRDITEVKKAREEQKRLEEQLQQAQKMESIGRLAGGVAHDFNNLLTGITGNISLAIMDVEEGSPLLETLEEVEDAADKAADLTRQLLAFSRKQIIEPKVVHPNELLIALEKMLGRIIGEDIDIEWDLEPDVGHVKVDPGQIEQVIVNMAVNAKDAMPDGGRMTIETGNAELGNEYIQTHPHIEAGAYVMIAVSDDGEGMDEATAANVFEPFFTTKSKDQGTGLGLATAFGIVKQHGGNIEVYTEKGEGTTFKIYLPRVDEQAQAIRRNIQNENLPTGVERILVVEDDKLVKNIAIKILKRQGYDVHHASHGVEAIKLVEQEKLSLDLLMTDIVMPNMNGRQLAEHLTAKQAGLKVLYTSGYTENVIAHHGVLDPGLDFIGKPYTPQALANKVRQVLDKK